MAFGSRIIWRIHATDSDIVSSEVAEGNKRVRLGVVPSIRFLSTTLRHKTLIMTRGPDVATTAQTRETTPRKDFALVPIHSLQCLRMVMYLLYLALDGCRWSDLRQSMTEACLASGRALSVFPIGGDWNRFKTTRNSRNRIRLAELRCRLESSNTTGVRMAVTSVPC